MPVYNRAYLIDSAIQSVLMQKYLHFELIIVDDGSVDEIDQVMDTYHDNRIRYLKLVENKGASFARNRGLEISKGDVICFLDSDDEFKSGFLEKMVRKHIELDADVIACLAMYCSDQVLPNRTQIKMYNTTSDKFTFLLRGNIFPLPVLLFDAKLKNGLYFNETYKAYEDYALLLKLHKASTKLSIVCECLVLVNESLNGVNKNYMNILNTLYDLREVHRDEIKAKSMNNYNFLRNIIEIEKLVGKKISFLSNLAKLTFYKQFYLDVWNKILFFK